MTEVGGQRTDDRGQMTEDRWKNSECGPGVVPEGRDYAAAKMRKAERAKRRGEDQKVRRSEVRGLSGED